MEYGIQKDTLSGLEYVMVRGGRFVLRRDIDNGKYMPHTYATISDAKQRISEHDDTGLSVFTIRS